MHKLHNLNSDLHEPSPPTTGQPKIESKFGPDTHYMLEPDAKMGRQERQAKVLTLHSKGYSQSEIANLLNINQYTVNRDIDDVRKKA